jgi:OmpA-OmpF porin, OOP family
MNTIRCTAAMLLAAALSATAGEASAQLDRIRRAADTARGVVGAAAQGSAPAEAPAAPAPAPAQTAAANPGEGAWVNYDFVPGSRPLFVDDFSRDQVGDFPRRLEFLNGNMEISEWRGARYLRVTSRPGRFVIELPEQLPERFTLEFDATPGYPNAYIVFTFADNAAEDVRFRGFAGKGQGGVWGQQRQTLGQTESAVGETDLFRGRIMADGRYVKVYVNDTRVANIPNAEIGRANRIVVEVPGDAQHPAFLGNLSVMAGGRKLYEALAGDGRVATQGILFDTGSDRIRPESTPTLTEIATMLREHPDLRLTIEGHTDNVGQAASNQVLSANRAAAVKSHLVQRGIDAARLESIGLGDTRPAAANDTPEGRQQNRRVELVRM